MPAIERVFFSDANPIGRRLVWGSGEGQQSLEIVAVMRSVKHNGPRDGTQLRFYLPYLQLPSVRPNWVLSSIRFFVRTGADPTAVAPGLRQLIAAEDPRLSSASVIIGTDLVGRGLVRERMVAILLVAFGGLAVGLACLGLYGLIAYHVVQCTSEIGIRMALGAQRRSVLWVMLRRAVLWIAAGIALGAGDQRVRRRADAPVRAERDRPGHARRCRGRAGRRRRHGCLHPRASRVTRRSARGAPHGVDADRSSAAACLST